MTTTTNEPARTEPTRHPTNTIDVNQLIDQLREDDRVAFVLSKLLGHTDRQAAEICNGPTGTIPSRVARVRATLATRAQADPTRLIATVRSWAEGGQGQQYPFFLEITL